MKELPNEIQRKRKRPKANKEKVAKPESRKTANKSDSGLPDSRWYQLNDFFDDHARHIKISSHALVWVNLYRHANPEGIAKISHSRLQESLGISESTVKRGIKELEACGYLKTVKQGGLVTGINVYQLCFPALHHRSPVTQNGVHP